MDFMQPHPQEQVSWVFDDNLRITKAILMSTHNICFYGEL